LTTQLVCAPGNGGIQAVARCVPVDVMDVGAVVALAKAEKSDFVVIGPEGPLVAGNKHFGPSKLAARSERSLLRTAQARMSVHLPAIDTVAKRARQLICYAVP
jgi:phosphoribosylamine---glycine ligase